MATSGRPQQAPALDGATQAFRARQLAPGAVPARPLALAAIPSLDTWFCELQNGGSPILSMAAIGTDSGYLYKEPPSPSSPSGDLKPPHLAPP